MKFSILIPVWLVAVLLLAGCAEGSPGTPGTATAHIDGTAGFYAGVGASH
ncbi:hypothetical protein ACELLULO517_09100 [Acidisoma cellulosilytica]|uniref:Uncharacterized protein n=1 Tax=Acidisoma cellulosilyticum TaxID=2802395 RepID=A0A963Z038_9PROT|nr:hypothetical protein [Acidisoma cellulosilyticum]MCB8880387.1 hypothetical protein [Acidisoma cellulosilyticum]